MSLWECLYLSICVHNFLYMRKYFIRHVYRFSSTTQLFDIILWVPAKSTRVNFKKKRKKEKHRTCAWQRELKDVIFQRDFSLEADVEEWRIHCPFVIPLKLYRVINLKIKEYSIFSEDGAVLRGVQRSDGPFAGQQPGSFLPTSFFYLRFPFFW